MPVSHLHEFHMDPPFLLHASEVPSTAQTTARRMADTLSKHMKNAACMHDNNHCHKPGRQKPYLHYHIVMLCPKGSMIPQCTSAKNKSAACFSQPLDTRYALHARCTTSCDQKPR